MNDSERSALRWAEIVAKSGRGEPVPAEDAHYRAAFEVAHPDTSDRETALWEDMGRLGERPWDEESGDDEIVAGALSMLDAPETAPELPLDVRDWNRSEPEDVPAPGRRRAVVMGVAFAALAAAAAVVLFTVRPGFIPALLAPEQGDASNPMAPSLSEPDDDVHEALDRRPAKRRADARHDSDSAPVAPVEEPLELEIEPQPEPEPERRRRVEAPAAGADELLRRAQDRLAQGDKAAALRAYARLLSAHPRSAEAQAALVSMGRIELDRNHHAKALQYFDRYLSRSAGSLREEARYGRIRALRALGRSKQELASIEAFLADHPRSLYGPRLQRRVTQLQADAR